MRAAPVQIFFERRNTGTSDLLGDDQNFPAQLSSSCSNPSGRRNAYPLTPVNAEASKLVSSTPNVLALMWCNRGHTGPSRYLQTVPDGVDSSDA